MNSILRRVVVVSTAIIFAYVGASCSAGKNLESSELVADYPAYADLRSAVQAADEIIVGKVGDSYESVLYPDNYSEGAPYTDPQTGRKLTKEEFDALGVPVTITKIDVVRSLKGSLISGTTIEVSRVGGSKGGGRFSEPHTVLLDDFDSVDVVLFLHAWKDHPYDLINPEVGAMALEPDGTLSQLSAFDGVSTTPLAKNLDEVSKAVTQQGE